MKDNTSSKKSSSSFCNQALSSHQRAQASGAAGGVSLVTGIVAVASAISGSWWTCAASALASIGSGGLAYHLGNQVDAATKAELEEYFAKYRNHICGE